MPGYDHRYWAERTAKRGRPRFATCRGDHEADVVVIGGGLSGTVAAWVLASGGLDVVLLEADRLAEGSTSTGLGLIQPDPAGSFAAVSTLFGRRRARTAWSEARRSALDFAAAIRRLPGRVELRPSSLLINSRRPDEAQVLRRELASRKKAGLHAPWIAGPAAEAELGTTSTGAIRLREVFLHDPVRTTLAAARGADRKGARLFERSPVRRTRFDRHGAEVVLAGGGVVRARGVFVATGVPGALFRGLKRHVREQDGYVVVTEPFTATMRREAGRRQTVMGEVGEDRHWLRWLSDHRAMFAGALSRPMPTRQRDRAIVQRTGQLMYELSLRYPAMSGLPGRWSWRAPVASTADGLPWIGTHRNYPFHYFAYALGPAGDALAWFAARAALRHFTDAARKEDATFAHRGS